MHERQVSAAGADTSSWLQHLPANQLCARQHTHKVSRVSPPPAIPSASHKPTFEQLDAAAMIDCMAL